MRTNLGERYAQARALQQKDNNQLQMDMIFGAGVLLGSDCPGASAAIETAFRRLFPDAEFPKVVP